ATLSQMRAWKLAVGPSGRNRCGFMPFGTVTGRNAPKASEFIFCLASWLRASIAAEPGMAGAYLDYEQQEFGIAAALSGDRNMMQAYRSGDSYLAFAVQAEAAPPDATKQTHRQVRERFKTCALGIQYSMGCNALGDRLGSSPAHGRQLIQMHRQ